MKFDGQDLIRSKWDDLQDILRAIARSAVEEEETVVMPNGEKKSL